MFKANQPNSYVPSKSVAIRPEVVSDVGQNEQIRINVPSFTGFLDPNQTFLKCDLEMKNCRGQLVPDPNGGVHSLFRNVLYRDGNNATTLELDEDYNANKSLLNHITQTPSTIHKRELFAGVQNSIGNTGDEQTLYYAQRAIAGGATLTAPDETKRATNKVEVQTQLNSGIWKQGNILPVSAMNGLRVQIDTDDLLRSCQYLDLFGEFSNKQIDPITMTSADIAVGAQLRNASQNFAITTDCDPAKNPFAINDIIYGSAPTGAGQQQLGTIQGFYIDSAKLGITYVPLRANTAGTTTALTQNTSVIFYKMADRQVALDFYLPTDGAGNVKNGNQPAPQYVLSNIEMVCQSVQPPPSYVEGLLRASQTEKGVSFDIMSYELFRHNQSNTAGLFQCQIPTLMKRAKSLFSQPLSVSNSRSLGSSSLSGIVDDAQNYEWIWGTNHYPSRLVPLQRYSQDKGNGTFGSEALHISELQKAVANVNEPVRNLHLLKDHFCISRSLTKYGQVMDLSTQTLSLRVDYGTGTEQKLFNNYVYGLRRITISRGQVMASSN
tara:strand:+ start:2114 stop:3763 length:1650 start_codon:yes stop_codon:yes gene_type:complete